MLDKTDLAHAVGDDDRISGLIAQLPRDRRADDGVEQIVKGLAAGEFKRASAAIFVVFEQARGRADDPMAAMGIAQADGHGPGYAGRAGHGLIAFPGDVVGGVANVKHRVEQQVHRARSRPDDQVDARDRVFKAFPRAMAHLFDAEKQHHRNGDGQDGQDGGGPAIANRAQGEIEDGKARHQTVSFTLAVLMV